MLFCDKKLREEGLIPSHGEKGDIIAVREACHGSVSHLLIAWKTGKQSSGWNCSRLLDPQNMSSRELPAPPSLPFNFLKLCLPPSRDQMLKHMSVQGTL